MRFSEIAQIIDIVEIDIIETTKIIEITEIARRFLILATIITGIKYKSNKLSAPFDNFHSALHPSDYFEILAKKFYAVNAIIQALILQDDKASTIEQLELEVRGVTVQLE